MRRIRERLPPAVVRPVASVVAVALVTAAIAVLEPFVPVLSLGVLYVFAVLPVAIAFGRADAVAVAVGSMLAFNFFFLPPLYTFTIADSRNWFALLVFVVTAVVVSELAARSRRRAEESALLAQVATSLLEHGTVAAELDEIAAEAARALHAERATIELGEKPAPHGAAESYALAVADRRLGTISFEGLPREGTYAVARRRLLPALSSLLGVAIDRERLAQEAVEAETLRRSDAVKTAVLRAVSHDLRSPLMAILTSATTLTRPDFELGAADQRELMETIRTEAERLDRLVGNLLDLSRLQAGAAEPEPKVWSVEDLIVQALDALGEAAGRVEVAFPDQLPSVRVDAHQIERVLVNLLENAVRYSPQGETVRVQVAPRSTELLVRIVDHGPGLAPDELEAIFEPFHRGSGSRDVRGAGLGLAIARGFTEANGGRIWAESREGQGASFVLALPVARVSAGALT
jgi:two-component system sensor histidine kinase KdpD